MNLVNSKLLAPESIHVVLDLETAGTTPGSVILQIGANAFSLGEDTLRSKNTSYSALISRLRSLEFGFTESGDTLNWWNKQDPELKEYVFSGNASPCNIMYDFGYFISQFGSQEDTYIWGNGANFDPVLLESYFNKLSIPVPWNFRNIMCFRTLKTLHRNLYEEAKKHRTSPNPHNAYSDAVYEALILQEMLRGLS